jgi:hypothetical protein
LVYKKYAENKFDFQKKYNQMKNRLLGLLQIEIDGLKEYIHEIEKTEKNSKQFSLKKKLYLFQLMFHNLTQLIDKKDFPAYPLFDIDEFIY